MFVCHRRPRQRIEATRYRHSPNPWFIEQILIPLFFPITPHTRPHSRTNEGIGLRRLSAVVLVYCHIMTQSNGVLASTEEYFVSQLYALTDHTSLAPSPTEACLRSGRSVENDFEYGQLENEEHPASRFRYQVICCFLISRFAILSGW